MARVPKSRWSIKWSDTHVFKAEQEGDNISVACVEDWCATLDAQLAERFGGGGLPRLAAASLNFSRCSLDDEALTKLLSFLYSRDITVQILKLFRNNIRDAGAWAVGQFMAHSSQAVHEVHLSHNGISEQGACALLELIAWSGKYPYDAQNSGCRDGRGFSPIWLRLEHNCIDWRVIDHRLHRPDLTWCTAESRDGWLMASSAPTVCLHASYRNQHDKLTWEEGEWAEPPAPGGAGSGQLLLAALKGNAQAQDLIDPRGPGPTGPAGPAAPERPQQPRPRPAALAPGSVTSPSPTPVLSTSPIGGQGPMVSPNAMRKPMLSSTPPPQGQMPQLTETEVVPLFLFLDVGAAHQMLLREDGIWRFVGLLNLVSSGHMKCNPPEGSAKELPYWVHPVQEGETIVTFLTADVLKDLEQREEPFLREELAKYNAEDPSSILHQCIEWGILEVVDTSMHTSLMHINPAMEGRARELQVSEGALKVLDFACVWQQQAESPGRVLVITEDLQLRHFGSFTENSFPGVIMLGELNKLLLQDSSSRVLSEVAARGGNQPQGAMLSAAVLVRVVQNRRKGTAPDRRTDFPELRQELHDAFSLITKVLRHRDAGSTDQAQAARMETAVRRWRDLLVRVY